MHQNFQNALCLLFNSLGESRKMVLATLYENHISARTMSVIIHSQLFYFQTDKSFRKYRQLNSNHQAALCFDNIQIEGTCEELGHPLDNDTFCAQYKKHFQVSFSKYSHLADERLFVLKPTFIQVWLYEDGKPFIQKFDFKNDQYTKEAYIGN